MLLGIISHDALMVIFASSFVATYFVADYLFTILWRNGFKDDRKKLYLTKMVSNASSLECRKSSKQRQNTSDATLSATGHNCSALEADGLFRTTISTSRKSTAQNPEPKHNLGSTGDKPRRSRHGLFCEHSNDEMDLSDDEQLQRQTQSYHKRIHNGGITTVDGKIISQHKHLNGSSPSSCDRDSETFYLQYNSDSSNRTPFSPLYNLPQISPYPTPFVGRSKRNECVPSSASLSEDAVDTPFRPLRSFESPLMGYNQQSSFKELDAPKTLYIETESLGSRMALSDFEFKVAMEQENPVSLGSNYNDPLAVMTSRFNKIKAKEKYQCEEVLRAVNRLAAVNSVEAQKRELLCHQFEAQDRLHREDILRNEKLRLEEELRKIKQEEELSRIEKARMLHIEATAAAAAATAAAVAAGKKISPLVQTPINNEIHTKISPTVKIAGSTVTNTIKPPTYVLDAQSLVDWLKKSESRLSGVVLPEEMTQALAALELLIHSFGVISSSSTQLDTNSHINDQMGDQMMEDDRDLNQNQNQSSAANSNIKGMLAVTSSAQKILRIGASLGGDIFLYVLSKLFRAAVNCVCSGVKPAYVTLIGNIIVGMLLVLPTDPSTQGPGPVKGPSLQEQGALVFKAILYGTSELCMPYINVSSSLEGSADSESRQKSRLAAVQLLGALIGTQSKSSPISVDEGWTWLVRLSNQLEVIGKGNGGHSGAATSHYQECCISLLLFLRQGSAALIARFGWKTIVSFLGALRAALSSVSNAEGGAAAQLISWIDSAIQSNGAKCAIDLRHHEPHVMASYLVISSVEDARLESETVDRDKGGPIMAKVKQLRIQTIPGIFNRLSASSASQTLVVNQLLEKIVAASREKIPELLRYTLCKVAAQLVSQAQSEFFIIEDESQSLPIARVAVGLCQIKPELADVIKAEYYRICPLTVPRQAEGGLVGDDMFDNMGFLKLRDTGGWEDSQQWLVRMNKVLCAFSVTLIQPEGAPFGLSDGWAWLSNMINACSRIPNPSSYTADSLDIFLRIVTPIMVKTYGKKFTELLEITEKEILPKLKEGSSKTRLFEFLKTARESNGNNFLPFFKKVARQ